MADASQIPNENAPAQLDFSQLDLSKLSDGDFNRLHAAGGDLSKLDDDSFHRIGKILAPSAFKPSGEDTTSMAGRFSQGFMDPVHGGAQAVAHVVPKSWDEANTKANNWVAEKTGVGEKMPEGGTDAAVRKRERDYRAARGEEADNFDVWRLAGNIANPANWYTPGVAAGLVRRAISGGIGGGVGAAFSPVTDAAPEDYWNEKAKQAGTGAAFGAVVAPVTGAIARVISPDASRDATKQLLRREGVPMTVGQTLGGNANRLEQMGQSVPWLGGAISDARTNAVDAWRNAFINRSQRPLEGGANPAVPGARASVNATRETYDKLNQAQTNVSTAYNQARAQLNNFRTGPQFQTELAQLQQMAAGQPWERDFNRLVAQNVTNRLSLAGGMTGDTYHEVVKQLGELATQNRGSKLATQQQYGAAIQQLNSLLEQQARRVNPQAASAFRRADAAFANLAGAQRAGNAASGAEGAFSPVQAATAIKSGDRSARKNLSSRGRAEGQDLVIAGTRNLKNTIPDSGTAGRLMTGAVLSGGAGVLDTLPELAALTVGSRLAYSPPLQRALTASIMNRPAAAQGIAQSVRRTTRSLGPLSGLAGLEYSSED